MSKKKRTIINNKALNLYWDGGAFLKSLSGNPDDAGTQTEGLFKGMSSDTSNLIGGIGSAVGGVGSTLISGGLESNAGEAIGGIGSTVGSIVGAVNPALGGAISAISGVVGGLTNKAFGNRLNQETINDIEAQNKLMANTIISGGSNEGILSQWGSQEFGDNFSRSDIGKDGWLSTKAKRTYDRLKREQQAARNRLLASYDNAIENTEQEQLLNSLATYAALGGPINTLKEGGGIHIKPSKKGTFTAAATKHNMGVQEFASHVLANKDRYTTNMIKKANFAKNASKWHSLGGPLSSYGTDWSNGVTIIGNGGTHEENPMEGVQLGVDSQGTPNLVEEGEVVFNDYVFSNRLEVPNTIKRKYKLRGSKELTFSEAAKQMQKESEERPNDSISKRGLENSMTKLQMEQEKIRQNSNTSNKFAEGGPTWLRYAPVIGSGIGLTQNYLSEPDYSRADRILDTANIAYTPVGYTPIGNYLSYNPLDVNYMTNKLSAESAANRNAILNSSSPSRTAALLAADYNAQRGLGDLMRQAEEYNLAQRQQVENFNRATNMANAEMGMKAAMANQDAALKAANMRLTGTAQAMAMKDAIDSSKAAARAQNMSTLFENLGNIGIDAANRADKRFYIKHVMNANLPLTQYAKEFGVDEAKAEALRRGYTEEEIKNMFYSKGGKLKKRGGFTY